jgi:hypothetical protein
MPRPASSCGGTVHSGEAPGRKASAAVPAASSSAPAAARALACPGIREAASAVRGSTLTVAAPAAGETL